MKFDLISMREDIKDIVPAVKELHCLNRSNNTYKIVLRNGKIKVIKGIRKVRLYLGWLLFHDRLIK
jgi:hypothetical protein